MPPMPIDNVPSLMSHPVPHYDRSTQQNDAIEQNDGADNDGGFRRDKLLREDVAALTGAAHRRESMQGRFDARYLAYPQAMA